MRILPIALLLSACSSTLTTFGDKSTAPVDGYDTSDTGNGDDDDDDDDFTTGDDDDFTTGDDDDTTPGDDDDDTTPGDDDDDTIANTAPVAVADAIPLVVLTGQSVVLDGNGSYDDDGDTLTYQWTLLSVPAAAGTVGVLNDDKVEADFVATWPGEYVAELVVDDGSTSASDQVIVTAEEPNEVPVANAGTTQRVIVGTIVTLDGSGSYDPNTPPDPLTWNWSFISTPAGSSPTLSNPASTSPTFQTDAVGDYELGLIVNDGTADSAPAFVRIISEAEPSGDDGDSCFSCAQANLELERRLTVGDAAGGFGLVLLPLVVLLLQRKEDEPG